MQHVAIIDYGAGNLRSVLNALKRVAAPEVEISLVSEAAQLADASHIILPGVGAFADCMRGLQAIPGMIAAMEKRVQADGVPFLGICVGMQMLFERGHEHGTHQGLGWIAGEVVPLTPQGLKVPHMGWNELEAVLPLPLGEVAEQSDAGEGIHQNKLPSPGSVPSPTSPRGRGKSHLLFENIPSGAHAYFVHSYHCAVQHKENILATTDYGGAVTAAVGQGNILGVQFHPEKSQQTGLQLFHNFLNMQASCLNAPNVSPN